MSVSTPSVQLRLAAVLTAVALVLHVVGFATVSWAEQLGRSIGLWQYCDADHCSSSGSVLTSGRHTATKALETIGFVLNALSTAGSCFLIFSQRHRAKKNVTFVAVSAMVGAIAVEVGLVVFGYSSAFLGYSFYTCLAGGIIAFIGSIFLFLEGNASVTRSFNTSSLHLRVAAVLCPVAFVLHVAGFTTPYWSDLRKMSLGLWQYCTRTLCGNTNSLSSTGIEGYNATKALETIGLTLIFLATVGSTWILFSDKHRTKISRTLLAVSALAGAMSTEIGIAVFGSASAFFGYSFYLCLSAGVVAFVASVFLLVEDINYVKLSPPSSQYNQSSRTSYI